MDLSGKRILLVKPSSLGDIVHTLPLAHAIKRCFSSSYIGWIVQQQFKAILENDPAIDEIISISIPSTSEPGAGFWSILKATVATISTYRNLRMRFKPQPYDLILDLHASFRSGLLGGTNPDGLRIGFEDAKELNTLFQHRKITTGLEAIHAVDKNMLFATHLGCAAHPDDFKLIHSRATTERAKRFLEEAGQSEADRVVYANPAARWVTKHWESNKWAQLADLLIQRAGAAVIFAGAPADVDYIQQITAQMKESPVVAAGKLNLAEAAALMELSSVYVGVDSGPMHIAAFVGTPVVALFGPTDPAKVGPYGSGHKVIQNSSIDCLACRKRTCNERKCLKEITAATVFNETVRLMGWG